MINEWVNTENTLKARHLITDINNIGGGSQQVDTAFELCIEMYAHIDWSTATGNVLVIENLEFIYTLLYTNTCDKSRIHFISDSDAKRNLASKWISPDRCHKYNNTINREEDLPMSVKFETVLLNPPYEDFDTERNQRSANGSSIWPHFVKLAHDIVEPGGWVASITPTGWLSPTSDMRNKNDYYLYSLYIQPRKTVAINIKECGRHFRSQDVSIDFSYAVTQNVPASPGDLCKVIKKNGSVVNIDLLNVPCMPTDPSDMSLELISLLSKVEDNRLIGPTHSFYGGRSKATAAQIRKQPDDVHTIPTYINAKRGYEYTTETCPNHNVPKVVVAYADATFTPVVDAAGECTPSSNCATIINLPEGATQKAATTFFNSNIVRAIINLCWWGKNQTGALVAFQRIFPMVDLTHDDWDEEEFYAQIGIVGHEHEQALRLLIIEQARVR